MPDDSSDSESEVEASETKPKEKSVKRGVKSKRVENSDDDEEEIVTSRKSKRGASKQSKGTLPSKARGKSKGRSKTPAKSVPKKPTTFKKGKWNPDIDQETIEVEMEMEKSEVWTCCCLRCSNRNPIRAAMSNDIKLMKLCLEDKENVRNVNSEWSSHNSTTAFQVAIQNGNTKMVELMLRPPYEKKKGFNVEQLISNVYTNRKNPEPYLLNFIDSGNVSNMAYGARIRKVQMTRGNRQGNNAFIDQKQVHASAQSIQNLSYNDGFLTELGLTHSITPSIVKILLNSGLADTFIGNLEYFLYCGNRLLSLMIVEKFYKKDNYGFNELHFKVLEANKVEDLPEGFRVQSIHKKATTAHAITPLHFACINPNSEILEALLNKGGDINCLDNRGRYPVHYAAACGSPENLKLCVEKGGNLSSIDLLKGTPLMYAARAGRHENVEYILETSDLSLNMRDKARMTAIGYASKHGHVETVRILIEKGAKKNVGTGVDRLQPLCWAASRNHFQLAEFLIEQKVTVCCKDKFKRTPLILAIMNGHIKLASLLLQYGAEWNAPDSSNNTPLHYAAGYGYRQAIDVLLGAGASINAENSWKCTPINIAMLKNHYGMVKRLLQEEEINVNGKDENGRTLISLSLMNITPETEEFVEFLIKEKDGDPNIADVNGFTPLHHLANVNLDQAIDNQVYDSKLGYNRQLNHEELTQAKKEKLEQHTKIAKMLLANGASPTLVSEDGKTPFGICLKNKKLGLIDLFIETASFNKDPSLQFEFVDEIYNPTYPEIFKQILELDEIKPANLNVLDKEGFTPVLRMIHCMVKYQGMVFQRLEQLRSYQRFTSSDYYKGNEWIQQQFEPIELSVENLNSTVAMNKVQYGLGSYGYSVPQPQESQLIEEKKENWDFFNREVMKPFISFLEYLFDKGVDPNGSVDKLLRFRPEYTEEMRLKEEQFKKGEIAVRKEDFKKPKKRGFGNNFGYNQFGQVASDDEDEDNSAPQLGKDGKEIEYGEYGMMNAMHLLFLPNMEVNLLLFKALLGNSSIDFDSKDHKGFTPFFKVFKNNVKHKPQVLESLLKKGVNIDVISDEEVTPFLFTFRRGEFERAKMLLSYGADVNHMDKKGNFAMKHAVSRRQMDHVKFLIEKGADIMMKDLYNRNLLHIAVNHSSTSANADIKLEKLLISKGVGLNDVDLRGRTPLHYAFVKIGSPTATNMIDPIKSVSAYCGNSDVQIDIPDFWGKTPLHYAAQVAATICSLELIAKGADLEREDRYGNTPLGITIMNNHVTHAIMLIQKKADVNKPLKMQNPKLFKDEMIQLEKEALGDAYEEKKVEVPNADDYGEEEDTGFNQNINKMQRFPV